MQTIIEVKGEKEINRNVQNNEECLNDGLDYILKLLQIYNVLDSDNQESVNKNQEIINKCMKRLHENTQKLIADQENSKKKENEA